jgi:hypothetical protein
VDEFGRTSLLMLAASIGTNDLWVMAASTGAVTLTPLRMMSGDERRETLGRRVLLRLADLGYVTSNEHGDAEAAKSPLSTSIGVLLLPWSLQAAVARLDLIARTTDVQIPSRYAPEDWLAAGHYFFDDANWDREAPINEIARLVNSMRGLPVAGKRHFIFGSLAGESSVLDSVHAGSHDIGRSRGGLAVEECSDLQIDPLAYTNPGSFPEGLSPLFARHGDRTSGREAGQLETDPSKERVRARPRLV